MELLKPDWNQSRPTFSEVQEMCRRIVIDPVQLPEQPFGRFLTSMRQSHDNGGAYLAAFHVGPDSVLDWYASRNRLQEERLLDRLLTHPIIRAELPELSIPLTLQPPVEKGFQMSDQFSLDGVMANGLYHGGAYWQAKGDGRAEKDLAIEVCDAMFGLRFGEVNLSVNYDAWTPWFKGIAWDLTAVLFDRRTRQMWVLAVTDTD
jgi:hypothetical protein